MAFPLDIPPGVRERLGPGTTVLLGISGGVDSAVSLAVLRELGCDVQCVTFKNFCYGDASADLTDKSCCSLEAIDDARRLAARFDAPHWVGDVERPFREAVIDPFIADYARAETPNPCLDCNGTVRFPELVRLAARQGCAFAATGHYARIAAVDGTMRLLRGVDPAKDQSYFLHRIDPELFPRLVFPLGWADKTQVRAAAAALGLPVATKRDSQEICFVPDGDRSFLFAEHADGPATRPGDIVDRSGRVLGRHRGLIHYTVGQRKGLGVAAPEPLYVLELDLAGGRLVVGAREETLRTRVVATGWQAAGPQLPAQGEVAAGDEPVVARIRHRHGGARVAAWRLAAGRLELDLAEPVDAPAPGQACVLYRGDVVLGGGRIAREADHG
ncbi:tRNA 2-thiouridine(34) synthase MnmA [bacterium]|nr:tRNA 2-thiouridine(34) synthase MnmA [bacterium]